MNDSTSPSYHELATKLSMEIDNVTTEWSPAVHMGVHNAVQIESTVFRLTATNAKITMQSSNDRENWRDVSGSTQTITAEGYNIGTTQSAIGSTWVRLKYEITGSATQIGILAAGMHLSSQD